VPSPPAGSCVEMQACASQCRLSFMSQCKISFVSQCRPPCASQCQALMRVAMPGSHAHGNFGRVVHASSHSGQFSTHMSHHPNFKSVTSCTQKECLAQNAFAHDYMSCCLRTTPPFQKLHRVRFSCSPLVNSSCMFALHTLHLPCDIGRGSAIRLGH